MNEVAKFNAAQERRGYEQGKGSIAKLGLARAQGVHDLCGNGSSYSQGFERALNEAHNREKHNA